jgi:integrase
VTAWTASETRRFLAYVERERLSALWRLAATTGMRRGELLGLRWQDVALDDGRLRVEHQALPTPGGVTFGSPKSKRSRRTVTLDAATVDGLREHRERQLLEQSLAGEAYEQGDLVFPDALGRPMHPNALSNQFIVRRRAAGVPVGSVHVLRHTAATLALEARASLHVVAARLGDRRETLLAAYAHLLPSSDADAADAVAGALVDKRLTDPPAPADLTLE